MSVDKFGRHSSANQYKHNLKKNLEKALGVQLDAEKNLNLHGRRIINLGTAIKGDDAVNKLSLQQLEEKIINSNLVMRNKIIEECERRCDLNVFQVETRFKSFVNKMMEDHIIFVEEKIGKIEDFIFKNMIKDTVQIKPVAAI